MQFHDSMISLVGNTPLVRLNSVTEGIQATVLAKVEYFNPGGSVKDRIAVRMIEAAEQSGRAAARRHDRRADQSATPAWAWRSWPSRRATSASSSAPTRCPRTRSTCCARTAPRWSSARPPSTPSTPTRTTTSPTGWCARRRVPGSPTSTPTRTTRARTTRPPAPSCGSRRTGKITHFVAGVGTGGTISGTGRYLKDASDGRVQVIGADPEGSVYSRRLRASVPGRGRRRGLLADRLRPDRRRRDRRRCPTRTPSR